MLKSLILNELIGSHQCQLSDINRNCKPKTNSTKQTNNHNLHDQGTRSKIFNTDEGSLDMPVRYTCMFKEIRRYSICGRQGCDYR